MAFLDRFRQAPQPVDKQMEQTPAQDSAMLTQLMPMGNAPTQGDILSGFGAVIQPIGREQILKAHQTLLEYKRGKNNLEQRIIDNDQWYKLRHWECMRGDKQEVQPTSAWLFNCIANKHADAMDNFPSPNILPREEGDKAEAKMLTSIIPVVLDQNGFEQTYSDEWDHKLKGGTGVYGIFWEPSASNGIGDISIKAVDVLNLFWEPGVMDIQQSRNFFHVELRDIDLLEGEYPDLQGKLGANNAEVGRYIYDDTVDTTQKAAVIDWYYRKNENGKAVLHLCKFVGDQILFASENDSKYMGGWYNHGKYPFVFDPLFRLQGTPCGFGYIDVGKSAQEYIDRGNQAIMQNLLANAKPRHFIRTDGSVNEEEYADQTKDFVHVDGNLGQDSIMPIQGKPLSNIYVEIINNKVDELKETTGNRDISTGGSSSGVTAASAIAAMQEAGSKLSRDHIKASYRVFREVCEFMVELIRQFYDMPRAFRIMGENGAQQFVQYQNAGIQPQAQGMAFGVDMGVRIPLFDIEITAQKQSPYSKMAQNELALQFYQAGFFNPQMADQALVCLDMMDFDRKEFIMQKISQNGGMYQQMMMMRQQMIQLAQMVDPALAQQLASGMTGGASVGAMNAGSPAPKVEQTEALGGKEGAAEPANTKKARQRVAESTSPT